MTALTALLAASGTLSAAALTVLAKHVWARWCAPQVPIPEYRDGRFHELEREVLGEPPSTPHSSKAQGASGSWTEALAANEGVRFASSTEAASTSPSLIGAVGDGAVPMAEYLWTWSKVDEHLFPAIGQLTHDQVENMADLGRAIQHWDSVSQWSEPSASLVAKVKGHLAEWVAADHLQQAGNHVELPLSSTQAGWDLDVDSVHVNVKLVDHFSSLGKHFAEYPDIPVLVPHDAVGIPEGAIHLDGTQAVDFVAAKEAGATVFVDDSLSNLDLSGSAEAGLEVGSGHIDLHIPWITMGISAFREGMLLLDGNTNWGRALKNVAVDTTAVGGGGALGAKAGAAIGTLFGPGVGTVIGAAIGGIAGALFGRSVANSVKRVPLDNAKATYDSAANTYESNRGRTTREADRQWAQERQSQVAMVKRVAEQAEREAKVAIEKAQADIDAARRLSPQSAKELLDATEATLDDRVLILESRIQSVSRTKQLLWPSRQFIADSRALPAYQAFLEDWKCKRTRLNLETSGSTNTHQVFDLALPVEQSEVLVRRFLTKVGESRAKAVAHAEGARMGAIKKVAEARTRAIRVLNDCRDRLARWINDEMSSSLSSLRYAQSQLLSEMRKAGMKV